MTKFRTYWLLLIPLVFANYSLAQPTYPKNKVDSLLHLSKIYSDEDKVNLYSQISSLFNGYSTDSVFYYANLAFGMAQKDKGDNSYAEGYMSLGNACIDKFENSQALQYYLKSKEYCEKINNKTSLIKIYTAIGKTYRNLKRSSEAIDSYKQVIEISRGIDDYLNEGLGLYRIASVYYDINDLNKSLEYSIKAANILLAHNLDKNLADAYNLIGNIHQSLKNIDLSQEYFEKAYALYVKINDIKGLSMTLNNLGIIYTSSNNQKAIENYSKSLEYAKKLNDDDGISTAMNNIGMVYVEIGQIDKGIDYYFKSLDYSIKLFDKSGYTNTFNNIAQAYVKDGNLTKAEEYVFKALDLAKKLTDLTYIQESYQILAKIYSKKGQFSKAFEYQELQIAYNDSLYTQQKTNSILEMQTRFETEAKEKEIQLLKKDNEIRTLEVERHKSLQKYLFLFSILLLVLVTVIFISQRVIRKNNLLLSQKNKELEQINEKLTKSEKNLMALNATKDKFFSIIAHDLKNPFNALLGFSELLEKNYETYTKVEIKEYINVIYESSQSLFKLLDNLLQWSRTQTGVIKYSPEVFNLLNVVRQEISYLQINADKKKITIKVLVENTLEVFADKNIISTVVRNLVNNAIKFTNTNGRVEVWARDSKNEIEISITDTGIGIDFEDLDKLFQLSSSLSNKGTANEEGTGLGLLLCKEFVERNGGRIWAKSNKGKGSTFYFTLPKPLVS